MSNKNSKVQMSLIRKIDRYFSLMIRAIIMEWVLGWNTIILKKIIIINKRKKKKKKTIFMMCIINYKILKPSNNTLFQY